MEIIELTAQIESLVTYEKSIDELKLKADMIRNSIKREMATRGVDELVVGDHIVRNTTVLSSRFDTKRFKEDFGADAYHEYCKEVTSKRFSIA